MNFVLGRGINKLQFGNGVSFWHLEFLPPLNSRAVETMPLIGVLVADLQGSRKGCGKAFKSCLQHSRPKV